MRRRKAVPSPAVIRDEADIRAGVKALRRRCPVIRRMHDVAGDPPLRRRQAGLEGLARIIVGQQVSVASADAIWTRMVAAVQPFDARTLLRTTDAELRAAGLSRPKMRTLRAVAAAIEDGMLELHGLGILDDGAVRAALCGISGIGPWTADVYVMFCLGRTDGFAPGDLALQVSAQMAFGLAARPSAAELEALAERWRPWRGVAARLLWAYYRVASETKSSAPL
jgi:DNA-3-methyladenine glycosylase II